MLVLLDLCQAVLWPVACHCRSRQVFCTGPQKQAVKSLCIRLHPLTCDWAQSKVCPSTVARFYWPRRRCICR